MGGKSSPPPPPDYVGAARETSAANLETARAQTNANRVNQYTPYGSSIWSRDPNGNRVFDQSAYDTARTAYDNGTGGFNQSAYDSALAAYNAQPLTGGTAAVAGTDGYWETVAPGRDNEHDIWRSGTAGTPAVEGTRAGVTPDRNSFYNLPGGAAPQEEDFFRYDENPDGGWSQRTELTPDQQRLLDSDTGIKIGLMDTAQRGLGYVQNQLNSPFDQSRLPQEQLNPGETAQAAILRRIQPQLDRDRETLRTQLVNQGLQPGSQAYNQAMERADRQSNDAYSQAGLQGIDLGQRARQQAIQEQSFFRNEPINMLNAVRSGAQVQNPTFGMIPMQGQTQGPDILGATTQGYNAQMANYNANQASGNAAMSGLFSLGSAALGNPFAFGSDEALKTDIEYQYTLPNGAEVYNYRWKTGGGQMTGFIAQQIQKVLPQAVLRDISGFLAVDYFMVLNHGNT